MSEKNITIRRETEADYRNVENLVRESFWNVYRPGCYEHYVIHCYRSDPAFVPELDFVMELDGELIGQVMYVRSEIECDDGRKVPIMTFGPIGIAPEYKRQGYGKRLLDTGISIISSASSCFLRLVACFDLAAFAEKRAINS